MTARRLPLARVVALLITLAAFSTQAPAQEPVPPMGPAGLTAVYRLADPAPGQTSSFTRLTLSLGRVQPDAGAPAQWVHLSAARETARPFEVWMLATAWPSTNISAATGQVRRYVVREGTETTVEYAKAGSREAVLPQTGAWPFLLPRALDGAATAPLQADGVTWLGRSYVLESRTTNAPGGQPSDIQRLELRPEVLVGVPSNRRTTEDRRRYDRSDYPTARLTRGDFAGMIDAGLNCFRADLEQMGWLRNEPVFVWGGSPAEMPYPECLFRSTWLGPSLFLDEPAVGTRDHVLRPRLTNDPAFRRSFTPQVALQAFQQHYDEVLAHGAPWGLINGLARRPDAGLGTMRFPQRNLYIWETMAETAAWELAPHGEAGPCAYVFEPPGRVGAHRTLPEVNMVYGCQIPPGSPDTLLSIIAGFSRGAARMTSKDWGLSIYGGVDRNDAPLWLTRAYDLGARYFFFWDNYELACVPHAEILALARHLKAHVANHPRRDLSRLRAAAETAILLPPGYGLGHVYMGRGPLWGLPELHLDRTNQFGIPFRSVMGNAFVEVERCIRLGTSFDLAWDLEGLDLRGYREVVRCREDGRVEVRNGARSTVLDRARRPERPEGTPPALTLEVTSGAPNGNHIAARAIVQEGSAPVYFTLGADNQGVHHNDRVLWELFGPDPEDYRPLHSSTGPRPVVHQQGDATTVTAEFDLSRPGRYRLRAATTDLAGRSAVAWKEIQVGN